MGNIGFSSDSVFEEPVARTHKMNVGTSQFLTITVQQFHGYICRLRITDECNIDSMMCVGMLRIRHRI